MYKYCFLGAEGEEEEEREGADIEGLMEWPRKIDSYSPLLHHCCNAEQEHSFL